MVYIKVRRDQVLLGERKSDMSKELTPKKVAEIEAAIVGLKKQLTGDMFNDMAIKDEIHNLEMKLKGVKPMDSHIDCIGCGS